MKGTQKTLKNICNYCAILYCWALLALLGCVMSICIASFGKPFASSFIHFPLGYPGAIGIDQNHNLYYLDNTYKRLKVYDQEGHFLRAWFVPISGNRPQRLIIDDNNHIYVETGYVQESPQEELYTVYDQNGNIIEEDSKKYSDVDDCYAFEVNDTEGNTFTANRSSLFPKVIQTNPSGHKITVISDCFYLRILAAGPNFVLFVGSILIAGILGWSRKKKSKAGTNNK